MEVKIILKIENVRPTTHKNTICSILFLSIYKCLMKFVKSNQKRTFSFKQRKYWSAEWYADQNIERKIGSECKGAQMSQISC